MRLTSFTDYTLRVLMYLALQPDRLATIPEIASAYSISANHLMKVVNQLVRQGVLESVRGKGGGIRLAKPATEIRIGEMVRMAEGTAPIVECLGHESECKLIPACKLAGVLKKAFDALYAELDEHTLADMVSQPQRLAPLVRLAANG